MNIPNFPNEADLIAKVQSGNEPESQAAFEELYRRHSSHLLFHLRSKGLTPEEQQEVERETWFRAVKKISKFKYKGVDLFPWICKIAGYVIKERFKIKRRSKEREEPLEDRHAEEVPVPQNSKSSTLQTLTEEEIREAVSKVLSDAPEDFRDLITGKFFIRLSTKDFTELYGWSESKVYVTAFRALKWLKEKFLERYGPEVIKDWLS